MTDSKQTVVITGANRGIGLAFTKHYLSAGCHVISTWRQEKAELDALETSDFPGKLTLIQLDVSDSASLQQFTSAINHQTIDILINNAGVYGPGGKAANDINADDWLPVFHINTIAPFMLAQALLPMLKKSTNAKIAFVSSKMGSIDDNTGGGSYIYRSSKAALNAVVKSLSIDLAEQEVKVIALHPGWVKTDMGGPNALIDTETSVTGMTRVIDQLTPRQSGLFVNYDGTLIQW